MSTLVANTIKPRRGDTVTFADCNVSVGGTITYEDVTAIDAVGIVTARSGIEVSGIVTAITGAAVTYYGSGSNLTGIESGVENFVASGTIANGATVILKDDGTVGIVTQTGSSSPSVGSEVVFESATSNYTGVAYDPDTGKVIIAYNDDGNSGHGTAIVGTVSGTSISFGSPTVFESALTYYIALTYDTTNDKVVIAYNDNANSNYGTAIVGTVSGTSISFGTAVVFESANSTYISATFDSTNSKVVITYRDDGNSYRGTSIVGTVSGTSISFGSAAVYNAASTGYIGSAYVGSGKVVIAYQNDGDSAKGYASVGTVSGTSISFGTAVKFEDARSSWVRPAYDSTNDKVVIAYQDEDNSTKGTAIVGTVSGTSISFGTAVVFESGETDHISATYDSTKEKVVIAYRDGDNSNYGTLVVGTVSGTSISFGSPLLYNAGNSYYISSGYDSTNGKVVIAYNDASNSYYGTSVVVSSNTIATNLTTENYIGIAGESIANAATGKINVIGGTNTGQSGLTTAQTYYVGQTGILTTTADTPSVVAGTSISSTEILIR